MKAVKTVAEGNAGYLTQRKEIPHTGQGPFNTDFWAMRPSTAHTWTPFSLQKPDTCHLRSRAQTYLGKCFLSQKDARKCQQLGSVDNCSSVHQPVCWLCIIYEYTYSLHWTTGHICNQEITLCQSALWGSGMGLFKLLEWYLQGLWPVSTVTLPVITKHSSGECFTSSCLALQDREYYKDVHQLFLARYPKLLRTVPMCCTCQHRGDQRPPQRPSKTMFAE